MTTQPIGQSLMHASDSPVEESTLLDISPVKHRMENLDALRILCMFVIILTHVTEPYLDIHHRSDHPFSFTAMIILAVNVLGRFGVPCFMMISFFIYWHQLYEKGRTWGELLLRRFKRLIPAFVVWSAFYFVVHRYLWRKNSGDFYTDLAQTKYSLRSLKTWWLLAMGHAEYHLYYLPLIMQCLLLIPLLRLLWKKPLVSWSWIGASAFSWCIMVYGPLMFSPQSVGEALTRKLTAIMYQPWAIPFLMYPLFGMMCAGQLRWRVFLAKSSSTFWLILLAVGLILHATEASLLESRREQLLSAVAWETVIAFHKLGRIITAFAVFGLFLRHPLMGDPFPKVSRYAFGLHFMHPFIIISITLAESKILGHEISQFHRFAAPVLALNLVLTLSITFGLCLMVGRFKRLEFLVV